MGILLLFSYDHNRRKLPSLFYFHGLCSTNNIEKNRPDKTSPKADSYAYEKRIRKWTKSVFFCGTKNMSEGHLMHTVLVCYVFDKLGQACLCG